MAKNDAPIIKNIKSPEKYVEIPKEKADDFRKWLSDLPEAVLMDWDKLPDIGLYMDQVLTLMDRQLAFYRRGSDDKMLTHAMINNYTKDGVLPRAVDKKYGQNHLALLSVVCTLKSVLSIHDLSTLLESAQKGSNEEELYHLFLDMQKDILAQTRDVLDTKLEKIFENEKISEDKHYKRRSLGHVAMCMALEARVRMLMTQKLIDLMREEE